MSDRLDPSKKYSTLEEINSLPPCELRDAYGHRWIKFSQDDIQCMDHLSIPMNEDAVSSLGPFKVVNIINIEPISNSEKSEESHNMTEDGQVPYFTSDIIYDFDSWWANIYYVIPKDGKLTYYNGHRAVDTKDSIDCYLFDSFEGAVEWIEKYGDTLRELREFYEEMKRKYPYKPKEYPVKDPWVVENPIPPHGVYDNYVKLQ